MIAHGLLAERQRRRDLAVAAALRDERQDLGLARGEPGRKSGARGPRTEGAGRRRRDRGDRLPVQVPRGHAPVQAGDRLGRLERRTVGARLGRRPVGDGGGEKAVGPREARARRAGRVAAAVQVLVMRAHQRRLGGEPGDPREHAAAEVGMHPHVLPVAVVENAGLRPDQVRDAQPSHVVQMRRAPEGRHLVGGDPDRPGRRRGDLGHAARVPQQERALQVGEVADRRDGRVEGLAVQHVVAIGRALQSGGPRGGSVRDVEQRFRIGRERIDDLGIELPAAALSGHADRRLCSAEAVVHLGGVCELGDPHRERDRIAGEAPGEPVAVVPLEGRGHGLLHRVREAEPLGQQGGGEAVRVQQGAEAAAGVDHERGERRGTLNERAALRDMLDQEAQEGQSRPVHQVGGAAHGDVVAEPARVLLRVGRAADPHEQRRLIGGAALRLVLPQPCGEPVGEDGRAHHVLRGLAETQVDRDGDRREHLAPGRSTGCRAHRSIVGDALLQGQGHQRGRASPASPSAGAATAA